MVGLNSLSDDIDKKQPHGLLSSIFDQHCSCTTCGWEGTVGDCEPDVDGHGNLGCPICGMIVVQEGEISL